MEYLNKIRTKPGNPYYLVQFENRTKPGTVLSETILSGDSLYIEIRLKYEKNILLSGNALVQLQRVRELADLWDITFCTR